MSIAQTEEKRSGELAHRSASPNGCIGQQTASEENRRFFELVLRSIFIKQDPRRCYLRGSCLCKRGILRNCYCRLDFRDQVCN